MENPIKMDDFGVPLFLETPICIYPESYCWRANGFGCPGFRTLGIFVRFCLFTTSLSRPGP